MTSTERFKLADSYLMLYVLRCVSESNINRLSPLQFQRLQLEFKIRLETNYTNKAANFVKKYTKHN